MFEAAVLEIRPCCTGLDWEEYADHALRITRPSSLSREIKIASVRASDVIRVYGYRMESVFYVLGYARRHDLTK